jgi:hypothetical protein
MSDATWVEVDPTTVKPGDNVRVLTAWVEGAFISIEIRSVLTAEVIADDVVVIRGVDEWAERLGSPGISLFPVTLGRDKVERRQ